MSKCQSSMNVRQDTPGIRAASAKLQNGVARVVVVVVVVVVVGLVVIAGRLSAPQSLYHTDQSVAPACRNNLGLLRVAQNACNKYDHVPSSCKLLLPPQSVRHPRTPATEQHVS